MLDHILPVIHRNPDDIMIHTGDVSNDINPIDNVKTIVKSVRVVNTKIKITFSIVITRQEKTYLENKWANMNIRLKPTARSNNFGLSITAIYIKFV